MNAIKLSIYIIEKNKIGPDKGATDLSKKAVNMNFAIFGNYLLVYIN